MTVFITCQGASTIVRKTLDWKRSRISVFEVEAVIFHSYRLVCVLFVESFDFRPSSQRILVSVIPSCFRFVNMFRRQVSLLSRCNPRYLPSSC
jgi:hypothetical protein